jgi:hypothetical protein
MGLLIGAIILWAIIALHDGLDGGPPTDHK